MANEYATIDEGKARLINKVTEAQEAEVTAIIEAASRAIDRYLEVEAGYYTPTNTASTRTLYGTGQSFINLPAPLSGDVTITAADGVVIPDFTVKGLKLYTITSGGLPSECIIWPLGWYEINGTWGYQAIPADIKEATLQLLVHFWRGRDKALTGTVTDMRQDNIFPERDFPRMTRRILDNIKYSLGQSSSGGLVIA